jgi:protein-glutamine gamma-glutamyltransferase
VFKGIGLAMSSPPNSHNMLTLLGCFAFILTVHTLHLPLWVSLACVVIGLWHLGISQQKLPAPTLKVLAPLTLLMALGIMLTFSGQLNKVSGLSLLMSMIALKLLETKTKRDFVIVVIAMYLVVGYLFLFSQSLVYFLLSLMAMLLLTAALLQLHMRRASMRQLLEQSAKMLLLATPIMLILFLLFPRASGPLWGGLQSNPQKLGVPGLSKRIELNQMSQNVQDSRVAFRVQFKGAAPNTQDMYWRGPVLWTMVGDQWLAAEAYDRLAQEQILTSGPAYRYEVTLEPNEHEWLLMLDMPAQAPLQGYLSKDYSVQSNGPKQARTLYQGISYSQYRLGPTNRLSRNTRRMALQIDEDANPRTVEMASAWSHLSQPEIVQQGLAYFKQHGFSYSLNPVVAKRDVIDAFLFTTKRGFCEHYATSFVTMMRAAGVPARVVTGYQGGKKNGDYFIVRQSDAHAWAEVWLETQGWVRIDPTAAIAPERVEQGISEAVEQSNKPQAAATPNQTPTPTLPAILRSKDYPNLHRALLAWDQVEHGWNQTVIRYHQDQQQSLLRQLTQKTVKPVMMVAMLIVALLLILGLTAFILRKVNGPKVSPVQQLYSAYIKHLSPYDLAPLPTETAIDFAKRVGQELPQLHQQAVEIACLYNYLNYSRLAEHASSSHLQRLKSLIAQFTQAQRTPSP